MNNTCFLSRQDTAHHKKGKDRKNVSLICQRVVASAHLEAGEKSVLGLVLFNIFINDVDNEIECTLSKLADDMELNSATGTPEGWDATQGDLDKLEKEAQKNFKKLRKYKAKYKLYLGQDNPRHKY
ncbi:hypothetical protein HGM15179_008409 [Zosterops borbonicus]|uniref:Uncharacterized protein n=1 Tax=Zosterops borbonicus TaxID=364589 RepID=A0A8K1GH26_9PASS|nr:hypothetical protein HGM15179_008409 [Zosterops borbonicus]